MENPAIESVQPEESSNFEDTDEENAIMQPRQTTIVPKTTFPTTMDGTIATAEQQQQRFPHRQMYHSARS
jgi:hypothetical protein